MEVILAQLHIQIIFYKLIKNRMESKIFALLLWTTTLSFAQTKEPHLQNLTQLTFGGDNAEAYFSNDNKKLIFQSNNKKWGVECDQIFMMEIAKAADSTYRPPMISTGKGRTTCSYFMPSDKKIVYGSTHEHGAECPLTISKTGKYIWNLYDFDIYTATPKGKIKKMLAGGKGYQAEATVSPKGDKIVYTSDETGDLELWLMDIDGKNKRQVTNQLGYDGGAFFSPDGKKLVFRASRPQTEAEIKEYKDLLKENLVAPTNMEICTVNVDGTDFKQVTHLGKANWAPFYHPSGKKIIFASNHHSKRGYDFQLYIMNDDGSNLEAVTSESAFNAFPMFSPDGKKLVFSSNRNNHGTRDTNVFIADWKE
jgi:TolB protein